MILFIAYIITLLYLIYLIWISEPLFSKYKAEKELYEPFISIVVSAKNESKNIIQLIKNLSTQTYPNNKFEIIIANDKSTDDTLNKMLSMQDELTNLKVINIEKTPENWASKKWALNQCISKAKGKIILQTDADCLHKKEWVLKMVEPFVQKNIGFVAGPSFIGVKNNFWNHLLKLESIAQESFSYANSKRQLYLSCTARNIAFRKVVFQEIEGYNEISHIKSGDDDLLLHKIVTQTNWNIRYIANKKSLVTSTIPKSIKSFYLQRLRYASKGLIYYNIQTPKEVKIILPFLFIVNLMTVISILFFINNQSTYYFFPILIKSLGDLILINQYMSKLKIDFKLLYFIILMIIHPFYIIIIGGIAPFINIQWK